MENFNKIPEKIEKSEDNFLAQEILKEADLIVIKDSDRDEKGLLLAPDGSVSHYQNELYWKALRTEAFKRWFAGSVVIHEDDQEPLIIFHSTLKKDISGLNLKLNEKAEDWNAFGIYFSSDKKATADYYQAQYKDDMERFEKLIGEDSPEKEAISTDKELYEKENESKVKTFGAFIKMENPLRLESHEQLMELSFAGFSRADLLSEHDGIIVENDPNFSDQYVVFHPENIFMLPGELK